MITVTAVGKSAQGAATGLLAARRPAVSTVVLVFLGVLIPALTVAAVVLHAHNGSTDLTSWWYGGLALAITMLAPGLLVAGKQPRNPVGWLMLTACLCEALTSAGREYLVYGLLGSTAPGWLWLGWFADSCYVVAIATLPLMLMLFPDGRALGQRGRYFLLLPIAGLASGWFGYLFTGDTTEIRGHRLTNPGAQHVPQSIAGPASSLGQVLVLAGMGAAAVMLVLRLRRAQGETRQQLKWVVWAGTIELVEIVTEFLPNNPAAVYTSTVTDTLFVAALAVAILRHRLFDIDVVIDRTLVFGALTLLVVGVYVGVVTLAGTLLGQDTRIGPGLLATAFVALGLGPARLRVQRRVDRLVYGERRNPYRVMTQLGERLQRDDGTDELTVVVQTVTQALKLPYAGIFDATGATLAESGTPGAGAVELPLSYQGAAMGQLIVRPRGRATFDRGEHRLLTDLARQIGAAVHAVQLSADLQASRRRLVSAKEEERRRLRNDLHDGLGPKLAALGLKLDTAHALAESRPEASRAVLGGVKEDIRQTIDDVRRLVYGLRPPALDELGLVAALRECGSRFEGGEDVPVIAVTASEDLLGLPAAVEVAAYWIVNEAMTNVVRHARATRCDVRLRLTADGTLHAVVHDDGRGLMPGWRPGVGTSSMRERAAELGGTVETRAGAHGRGTVVDARIPCEVRGD